MSPAIPLVTLPTPVGELDLSGWNVLWALVATVAAILVARYVSQTVLRLGHRVSGVPDDTVLGAARIARYVIYLAGLGVVLGILGAEVRPLLVALLVVLGAIVLLGRGIADNLGAGLLIQTRRTVKLGDLIECSGHAGHVIDLNSRSVVIETLDGVTIHLPNKLLLDGSLLNYTTRGAIRSELEVRVALGALFHPGDDRGDASAERAAEPVTAAGDGRATSDTARQRIVAVIDLVLSTASDVRGVQPNPAPDALVVGVDPDRVRLHVRFWHDADVQALVCSRMALAITEGVDAHGLACAVSWPPPPPPLAGPGAL
ncbi:mechanosensitive ion channel family protein [Nocardioides sp. Iso805N]|uniref:mechanosensitive ion channel family protein n=1 Tax=Nocardioides sp. Iso805N TaxID=1283287 RepID=UPI000371A26F|nr:mechanosensitive ion channel family protein [Nocardioides sp. Iso805N]